jgi:hypothetical protein
MSKKMIMLGLSLLLLLASFTPGVLAADAPKLSLASQATKVKAGEQVKITAEADGLTDLYGFELQMAYDQAQFSFVKAEAGWQGFSIPQTKDGSILFAHTKMGQAAGENGKRTLATFTFTAKAAGAAVFELTAAKLVSSNSTAISLAPAAKHTITVLENNAKPSFSDIEKHWGYIAIERAATLGIVAGYPDGRFQPDKQVTRAEFAAMLSKTLKLPAQPDATLAFADASSIPAWAKPYIAGLSGAGIITGYADHTFRSDSLIVRSEMAVMIAKAAGAKLEAGSEPDFADKAAIPAWARPAAAFAKENGLVKGRGGNKFVPNGLMTRAEAVTVLIALLDQSDGK